MSLSEDEYQALKAGDTVTDCAGHSVELLEESKTGWHGRVIGEWRNSFRHFDRDAIKKLVVRVWTLEEKTALRAQRAAQGFCKAD